MSTSTDHLQDLARPIPLREYLLQILARRDFALSLPAAELRARNATTLLGAAWLVLNPLFLILVYYLLFSVVLDVGRGVPNFAAFLGVGIFTFQLSQRTIMAGSRVILRNQSLMRTLYFPRAILPLSVVIENLIAYVPALVVLLLFAMATGESPRLAWLLIVPLTLFQSVFNLGASFWAARLGDKSPDFANVLPYFFRILLYGSGVLYAVENFVTDERLLWAFDLNPFYCLVAIAREIVLGLPASPTVYLSLSIWSVVLLLTGFIAFRRGEASYGIG